MFVIILNNRDNVVLIVRCIHAKIPKSYNLITITSCSAPVDILFSGHCVNLPLSHVTNFTALTNEQRHSVAQCLSDREHVLLSLS